MGTLKPRRRSSTPVRESKPTTIAENPRSTSPVKATTPLRWLCFSQPDISTAASGARPHSPHHAIALPVMLDHGSDVQNDSGDENAAGRKVDGVKDLRH